MGKFGTCKNKIYIYNMIIYAISPIKGDWD